MIDELNKHLPLEITAHTRYNGHAQIFAFRGYTKLAERYKEASEEELGHVNKVVRRIQQLGGFPNYLPELIQDPISKFDIVEILKADLATEEKVLASLTEIIECADEKEQDWETDNVLRTLVSDTEDDIQYYTAQLAVIDDIGVQNYLASQL